MYSYQHQYHAGNFADVHKHLVLLATLNYLLKKPTKFCILDAFAGEGLYDLDSPASQKNAEHKTGYDWVKNLNSTKLPTLLPEYLNIIKSYQHNNKIIYPGSPGFIAAKLREIDRAICIENHPQAFANLKLNFGVIKNFNLHKRDAFEGLNSLVPFPENRGIIFLDPSYEVKTDYEKVYNTVNNLYQKFKHGIFIIWYPVLQNNYKNILLDLLKLEKTWQSEIICADSGMIGSGIIVINMPWNLDRELGFLDNLFSCQQYPA